MIAYRRYRNTDPPALVEVWNESLAGRGGFPVRNASLFERWLFSKPYFDAGDFTVAVDEDTGKIVGFSLAGFGPNEERTALSNHGVICATLVRPPFRRRGIGRELVRRAEEHLRNRGAADIVFGSLWPNNPYLFGLYGGSNSPGVLGTEPEADGFLRRLGYEPVAGCLVFHKKLDTPLTVVDTRFAVIRRKYDAHILRTASVASWWEECMWGSLEPVELRLTDKTTNLAVARTVVWELEGFGWKWNIPAAGIIDMQVHPELRKQGLGKMLVAQALRFLQDQFFAIAELQVPADNEAAVGMCKSLGFEQVDTGHVYRRP